MLSRFFKQSKPFRTKHLVMCFVLFALLSAAGSASAVRVLNNGKIRIGNGINNSVTAMGYLKQPFFYNTTLAAWRELSYPDGSVEVRIGAGGDGTNNWNINGQILENPTPASGVTNNSGFVVTDVVTGNGYGTIVFTGNITINGQVLALKNTYTLGQNDAFMKVVTRITNNSGSTVTNLRVWVGSEDDFVGSDEPTKRRGNLIGGVFSNIALTATRSAALLLETPDEGELFYSPSTRAYTSISTCCAFANAANQDPATSSIIEAADGSYALYVRLNDLLNTEGDEFTWYFGVGELANLPSIVATAGSATIGSVALTVGTTVTPFVPVTVSGGTAPFIYSISPALPSGLALNPATGQITGTPTAIAASTVHTVTIVDSNASPVTTADIFTLDVNDIQTISFSAQSPSTQSIAVGSFTINPIATAGPSSSPIVYSTITTGVCTVSGTTVAIVATGTCTIRASQAGDANYNAAASVDQSVVIVPVASQSIIFANPGSQAFGTAPTLTATATSGLTPIFTSDTGSICTITSGGVLTFVTAGTCTIVANQSGNVNYSAAVQVSQSFNVVADTIPGAFSFTAQTSVALNSVATSNTLIVSGINSVSAISIVGGTYSINGGAYVSTAGTVTNGQTVTVQQTASGSYGNTTTATLTIGGVSGAFSVTTLAVPVVTTSHTATSATGSGSITASFTGGGVGCGYAISQYIPLVGHAASPPAGTAPAGISFPRGLFDFITSGCAAGATLTVTITYSQALPPGTVYWKYGRTAGNVSPHWYQLPAVIAGNTVIFSITDGGLGDDDLT